MRESIFNEAPGNPALDKLRELHERDRRVKTLSIEVIDAMLASLGYAEEDENWNAVDSMIAKIQVVLLADIAKKLDKLVRALS